MSKLAWNNWKHPDLWAAFDMQTLTEAGKMKDMTGNGRDLTINGTPAIVDSILPARRALDGRKARYFNGTTDSLTNTTVQPPVECTIIAVLRLDAAATTNLAVYLQNNTYPTDLGYTQYGAVTDKPTIYGRHNNTMAIMPFPGIGVQHVAALVKNGTRLTGYLNGMRRGAAAVASDTSSTGFAIGAYNPAAPSSRWQGVIDVVHIYNRALTDAEIDAWYQSCQYMTKLPVGKHGTVVWDGVREGIWDSTSKLEMYYTGSITKNVTPTMNTPNYWGLTGITDGKYVFILYNDFHKGYSFMMPQADRLRFRLWLKGLPYQGSVEGKMLLELYTYENNIKTIRGFTYYYPVGLVEGWNEVDIPLGQVGGDFNRHGTNIRISLDNLTAHPTNPLTEVVIADMQFYKSAKTRYDFNDESDLADWPMTPIAGTTDGVLEARVENGKRIVEAITGGTEVSYWGQTAKHSVSFKGDFRIRFKMSMKRNDGSFGRHMIVLNPTDNPTPGQWGLGIIVGGAPYLSFQAVYAGGGNLGEIVNVGSNVEATFEIVRHGQTISFAVYWGGRHLFQVYNNPAEITAIGIYDQYYQAASIDQPHILDYIEWEEL